MLWCLVDLVDVRKRALSYMLYEPRIAGQWVRGIALYLRSKLRPPQEVPWGALLHEPF